MGEYGAHRVIAEANQGGEVVRSLLAMSGSDVPIDLAHARAGTGHWPNGRVGAGDARHLISAIAGQAGLSLAQIDLSEVSGSIGGYVIEQPMRTPRYGGDSWEAEPPLCEDYERYRVQVFDGADMVREVEVDGPSWVYGGTEQAVDFPGGFGSGARVEIAQKSQVWGYGPVLSVGLG
ncbi:hypothetical protein ABENE_14700 [Asticcacaulis benevestitus DSM 16100 = ATCC BAA-896]|uniref:Uncharacterized protein n=1 Tax=Asticcacaulis benevestitus DSM 16100 = ATCC BAA-896 TaxID=1121022 RepID=V4RC81_9CAUL|nr:hypothetical protein ABENE_14700 [Asticcacaulis benevestitus DSM 16100 = ATCC BAA-896]